MTDVRAKPGEVYGYGGIRGRLWRQSRRTWMILLVCPWAWVVGWCLFAAVTTRDALAAAGLTALAATLISAVWAWCLATVQPWRTVPYRVTLIADRATVIFDTPQGGRCECPLSAVTRIERVRSWPPYCLPATALCGEIAVVHLQVTSLDSRTPATIYIAPEIRGYSQLLGVLDPHARARPTEPH